MHKRTRAPEPLSRAVRGRRIGGDASQESVTTFHGAFILFFLPSSPSGLQTDLWAKSGHSSPPVRPRAQSLSACITRSGRHILPLLPPTVWGLNKSHPVSAHRQSEDGLACRNFGPFLSPFFFSSFLSGRGRDEGFRAPQSARPAARVAPSPSMTALFGQPRNWHGAAGQSIFFFPLCGGVKAFCAAREARVQTHRDQTHRDANGLGMLAGSPQDGDGTEKRRRDQFLGDNGQKIPAHSAKTLGLHNSRAKLLDKLPDQPAPSHHPVLCLFLAP